MVQIPFPTYTIRCNYQYDLPPIPRNSSAFLQAQPLLILMTCQLLFLQGSLLFPINAAALKIDLPCHRP